MPEAERSILDALPSHIVVLDPRGGIVAVNRAWHAFGAANGLKDPQGGLGTNYLSLCRSSGPDAEVAAKTKAGIESVLAGTAPRFELEYPCHGPMTRRWFHLMVSPVTLTQGIGALVVHTDCGGKHCAEESLQENHSLLRAIIEGTSDTVFVKDLEGRYLMVNAASARALRRSVSEIIGRGDDDLFPPEVAAQLLAHDQRALALGRSETCEESIGLAGMTTTHLTTKSPYHDSRGMVIGLIGISKDITERKRIEDARERQTERLSKIIAMQQAVATGTVDSDQVMGRIVDRVWELVGGSGAGIALAEGGEMVIRAASGKFGPLLGYRLNQASNLIGRCFRQGQAPQGVDLTTDPGTDGELWRSLGLGCAIVVPIQDGSRPLGVLAVTADQLDAFSDHEMQALLLVGGVLSAAMGQALTFEANLKLLEERAAALAERHRVERALIESEDRLRSALDAARLGVWDWNLRTGLITWSGHHEALYGISEGAFDGTYDGFIACIHPDDREATSRGITTAMTSRKGYAHEHRVVWPDGTVRWIAGGGQFLYDGSGSAVRMVGAVMDVTERRILEHHLVQAQKIEAIGQLAAGIAHEINTPIQYVGDNLHFLRDSFDQLCELVGHYRVLFEETSRDGLIAERVRQVEAAAKAADLEYLTEEIPRATRQSLEGVERVAEIVRAMKDFSHPGTAEKTPADLNRSIGNTVAVSGNEWKYVAEMVLDLDPALPPVPCRLGEIQQVMLNLIVNSAHAIADRPGQPESKGTITVSTRHLEPVVEIRVTDTGAGIPEYARPKVFDPFFTTKEVGRGTGQGLSIAHDVVVKIHGGSISFETEVGVGTTFVVRLPLHPADILAPEA